MDTRVTKLIVLCSLCGVMGFAIGWLLSPGPYRLVYRTKADLAVTDSRGEQLGRIPSQSALISSEKLDPNEKLGWWACVPMYFGTMHEANELVQQTSETAAPMTELLALNAIPLSEVISPKDHAVKGE